MLFMFYLISAISRQVDKSGFVHEVSVASGLDEAKEEDYKETNKDEKGQKDVGPEQARFTLK